MLDGRDPAILTEVFSRAAAVSAAGASAALRSAFLPQRMVTVAVGDTTRFEQETRDRSALPVTVLGR